ncbi:hypothetical protein [Marivita sp.]|uniref:hypothetical protein n=1 Tax=Marivita sp. TaxID=2003365 RepID=UPI003A8B8742
MLYDCQKDPEEAPEARCLLEAIRQIVFEGRLPTERQLAQKLDAVPWMALDPRDT